jgi:hypothetical protein
MNIIDYKKFLKLNNIKLFDHDIRISHYIINNIYNNNIYNNNLYNNQKGGNISKNILLNKSQKEINDIINTALSPNYLNLLYYKFD